MFKNIKSLFIVEEEDSGEKKQPAKGKSSQPQVTAPSPPAAGTVGKKPVVVSSGEVDQKFLEILFKAMEHQNLDGFDYLEYKQSLNSLKKMPMDEATRYQSAFAMAQTMGASPSNLLQSAQHYLDVLNKEEQKFGDALAAQQQKQIGSKEQDLQQLDKIIKNKADQIRQLTQEIEAHQQQMVQLKKEITESAAKVESTKNDFIASYTSLVKQIQEDMENIQNYLK